MYHERVEAEEGGVCMWPVVHMYKWKIAYRSERLWFLFLLRYGHFPRKPASYLERQLDFDFEELRSAHFQTGHSLMVCPETRYYALTL